MSYTYNSEGIRTGKTVDGTTTKYLVDGSTVIAQQTGSDVLWFLYESDGNRVGFTYDGTAYYYTKNAQGDVTGIVDGNCNTVAEYSYDAWGKLLSTTGSLANTIGKVNPFLYRGYCYDSETGLYYLNSRYYDPQTGRFISEDGAVSTGTGILGHNMFAYCNNNPASMTDSDGTRPLANPGIESPQDQMIAVQYENEAHKNASNYTLAKTKPNFTPRKDKKKGSEDRQKTGDRERNVAHPNGEEHSRVPKGNGIRRIDNPLTQYDTGPASIGVGLAIVLFSLDDFTGIGVLDDAALLPLTAIFWDLVTKS